MKISARILLIYIGACSLYIIFSDLLVFWLFPSTHAITNVQSYKGIAFVLGSGLLLFWLLKRYMDKIVLVNKRLTEANAHHQLIFDKSPLPSYILDQKTLCFVRVNEAAQLKFGRSEKEYLTCTPMDFLIGIDETELFRIRDQVNENGYMEVTLDSRAKHGTVVNQRIFCQKVRYRGKNSIICMALDITSTKDSDQVIMDKMLNVLENDRRKIAREIHDSIKQYFGIIHGLLKSSGKSEVPHILLSRATEIAAKGIEESRRLSHSIIPGVGGFNLVDSLEYMVENLNFLTDVHFVFESDIENDYSQEVILNLYRIAQEATTNIRNHSGAKNAKIALTEDDNYLILEIRDNGNGLEKDFTSKSLRSIGLSTMRTRATKLNGYFSLQSEVGKGTTVRVRVPIVTENINSELLSV